MKKVDVIIPVYKPDEKFKKLLLRLKKQTVPVNKIILFNTERKYFDSFFYGTKFFEQFDNVIIKHVSEYEFDHGRTRRAAVELSDADYFICMTDDAMPKDRYLIEELLTPILEGRAAVSYARQMTGKNCSETERFTRKFNYPEHSRIKTKEDIKTLGIKAFFCSNVCACYDRKIYDTLGGFIKRTIFNEDMIYAYKVLDAGYSIAYCADAKVIHQHNYNNIQQLKRNFDLGVSHAMNPEIFGTVKSESEGKKLVRETTNHLKDTGNKNLILPFYIMSGYKYLGYLLGKNYKKLPKWVIKKLTMNKNFWRHVEHND